MLPTRAYADRASSFLPGAAAKAAPVERPVTLFAIERPDIDRFAFPSFARLSAHTTAEAIAHVETAQPHVVIIDWDAPQIDGVALVRAARQFTQIGILVVTAAAESAPAAIKAGCHTLLLKPCAPNLLASRIGRLVRDIAMVSKGRFTSVPAQEGCTHRTWPGTACPECQRSGATSFEYASYRRMWYACLACDHVWLGPRQE